jgi:dipeptidyl-peptidase 4
MTCHRVLIGCYLLATVFDAASAGEKPDASLLTVDRIFGGKEFDLRPFAGRWLKNRDAYTVTEKSKENPEGSDIVRYEARSGGRTVLVSASDLVPPGESKPLSINGYAFSKDLARVLIYTESKRVWRQKTRGDYWVLDRSSRQLRKIGRDARPSSLMFAKFSPAGRQVAYIYDRNIYVEDLVDRSVRRLTESRTEDVINGTFDWVYEEEFRLRDGFRWSPDGKSIAYWQINTQGMRKIPLVNNTDSFYPKVTWVPYPKTGQRNPVCRIGVVKLKSAGTRWMKLSGDSRDHYLARMDWAHNSRELLVQQFNRLQNANRVLLADARTGKSTTLFVERDKAWVDAHDEVFWLSGGKRFTWISEREGWRHVYLASRDGKTVTQLTTGRFDVIRLLAIDERHKLAWFIASPDNAAQRFLFRVNLDGTGLQRVTPVKSGGWHDYRISPSGRWAIHTASSFDQPPVTDLVQLPDYNSRRVLQTNRKLHEKVRKLKGKPVEFFRAGIGGGVQLDAWCLRPPNFDEKKCYPLLVYVYGEPAGQTVVDRWSGTNGLWHRMLAQRGYVVMSFDNRGTKSPRGRDWRKCVYRKIGILAPKEQAAAVKAVLRSRPWLDPGRVGIWGWSGGGSSSLQAIFKYPDLYHTAIAVAAVPNQRYYDTIYQERYMGLPRTNVDGYRNGSAINFARNLKGDLLLIHGTGDDNCHYQTTELLINELIRNNKQFQMFAYPNRTHAIREGKNTTRHLRAMMTSYLLGHLPPGPRKPGRTK